MQINILFYSLFVLFTFSGCSWMTNFFIVNETDMAVRIDLKCKNDTAGFPIFYEGDIIAYQLSKKGKIDYKKNFQPDTKKEKDGWTIYNIPPRSALKVASLSNDNYVSYDQAFINRRIFNLDKLLIYEQKGKTEIIPSSFDQYFKKSESGIVYRVK